MLGRHGFLRGLTQPDLDRLAAAATHVEFPAGHRLFDIGGTADRFWLLENGLVELELIVPGAPRLTVESLGIGDVLGWSWLFPPYQWRFGAVVHRTVHGFELDGRAVRAMCQDDPDFGYDLTQRFLAVVLNRLQATRVRLMDLYLRTQSGSDTEAVS
ncbi:MAG: hypothetical protein GEV07_06860 [Streptosporangiales bacterium]|nr:hypothetical protein [Streptosporangiales bacterium]